ncbi:MAG: hypothetical protein HYZ58_17680 [Acidobacteria bacterium]|nr:hypothetical protein [Acidobacteriota bacterium]
MRVAPKGQEEGNQLPALRLDKGGNRFCSKKRLRATGALRHRSDDLYAAVDGGASAAIYGFEESDADGAAIIAPPG